MYTPTRTDLDTFVRMDSLWSEATSERDLEEALESDNWQVQLAALAVIGDRCRIGLLPALEALLDRQDQLGIYACPWEWELDPAPDETTREIWRCRFRVKQGVLVAIRKCVETLGPAGVGSPLLERLHRYAVSMEEDYPVRAAACDLLGVLRDPASVPVLEQAARDGEGCTAMTASRALDLFRRYCERFSGDASDRVQGD